MFPMNLGSASLPSQFKLASLGVAINNALATNSRWVTTLNPAGGMYYDIPQISLTDFEIEIEFETTQTGNRLLLCDDHLTTYYMNSYSNILSFWSKGTEYATPVTGKTINDGKLHTAVYKLAGTQLKVFLDSVQYGTHTINPYLGVINFKAGNRTALTSTFDGSYFGIKIWNGGDRHTGQLVRDYRFNDSDGVLVDYSKPLGTELLTNTSFSNNSEGWPVIGTNTTKQVAGNALEITQVSGGYSNAQQFIDVEAGKTYLVTGELFDDGGYFQIRDANNSAQLMNIHGLGVVSGIFTATSNRVIFRCHCSQEFPKTFKFKNPSLRKAAGYGKAVNVTAADRELMTFDDHRNAWVGGELISLSSQTLSYSSAFDWRGFVTLKPLSVGTWYLSTFKFESGSGQVRSRLVSDKTVYVSAPSDVVSELGVATQNYYPLQSNSTGVKVLSNLSLKRIIEVTQ